MEYPMNTYSKTLGGSLGYQVFVLVLSVFALVSLGLLSTVSFEPSTREILGYADNAVCALFFADFLYCLTTAEKPWKYFRTWGWIDLLSSIPMLDISRWGRLTRVFRIFRVLRGFRATKILASLALERRAHNTILAASLVALLLITFSSIAILQFESVPEANIKTAEDAVWWAMTTITTVGYGDRFPVTSEGRMVAMFLMCAGVGLFGVLSGFLASWFLSPGSGTADAEVVALRREVAELKAAAGIQQDGMR